MDKIFIKNLKLNTIIGVYPHESEEEQPIVLDLEITLNSKQAALTDDLNDTIDYDKLVDFIRKECKLARFKLLEALAEHLSNCVIKNFKAQSIQSVQLTITKPNAIKDTPNVGLTILREF